MKFRKKQIAALFAAALMLVGMTGCGASGKSTKTANDYNVDGIYQIAIASEDEDATVLAYDFDLESGTYEETLSIGDMETPLQSGTFTVDEENNLVTLTADADEEDADSEDTQEFILYGQYLIAKDFVYEGEIPSGKKFTGVLTNPSSGGSITFEGDGTYSDGTYSGDYTRKGDFISRTSDDGSSLVDLLIVSDDATGTYGVTNSYFVKQ